MYKNGFWIMQIGFKHRVFLQKRAKNNLAFCDQLLFYQENAIWTGKTGK